MGKNIYKTVSEPLYVAGMRDAQLTYVLAFRSDGTCCVHRGVGTPHQILTESKPVSFNQAKKIFTWLKKEKYRDHEKIKYSQGQ